MSRRRVPGAVAAVVLLMATVMLATEPASPVGTLDASYGTGGGITVGFSGSSVERVTDFVLQSDDKAILLVDTDLGFGLVRLTTSGALDPTFDGDGRFDSNQMTEAFGVALLNGGPVVVGRSAASSGSLVVARFTQTGQLDPGFSGDGLATVAMVGIGSGGVDVAVSSTAITTLSLDDIGGSDPGNPIAVLHRFGPDGELDTGFGTAGRLDTGFRVSSGSARRPQLVASSDGRPVALLPSTIGDRVVSFHATTGVAGTPVTMTNGPRALLASTDGRIVVAGGVGAEVTVARFTSTMTLDTTFGPAGQISFDISGRTAPRVHAVAERSDGSLVLAGREDVGATSPIFLVPVTAAGTEDVSGSLTLLDAYGNVGGVGVDTSGRVLVGADELVSGANYDAVALRVLPTTAATTTTTSTSSTSTTAPVQVVAGGTASTGGVPNDATRVIASVTTPIAGSVGFTRGALPTVANHRVVGAITVTAPQATAVVPLQLRFDVDLATVPTSVPVAAIAVLRDGVAVPTCLGPNATPDPCVTAKTRSGNVLTVTVRSSRASTWSFTRPVADRVAVAVAEVTGDTTIAASRAEFAAQAASAVVLARTDDFADALAGIPLARRHGAPLLLTTSTALTDAALTEITRVLPAGKTVYLLGGESALGPAVVTRLRAWGYEVVRYGGTNRYETAAVVATHGLGSPTKVIETTGANFADAFAAGAVAAKLDAAVLLTDGEKQTTATAGYLARVRPTRYAVGGPATRADTGALGIAGRDRYETAVLTAREFFPNATYLTMAGGLSYPDAAAAASAAARAGAPLLLLPTTGDLPVPLVIYLDELYTIRPTATVFGPTTSVSDAVLTPLRAKLTH